MLTLKTILFATDFSEASAPASGYALSLAKLTGAHLHVLHVISELEEPQRVLIPREAFQTLQHEIEVQAVRELECFCRKQAVGLETTTHAIIGIPFRTIIATAESVAADMIVMGTHGRTGMEHVLVGSTAERVVRQSRIPVLTVRSHK